MNTLYNHANNYINSKNQFSTSLLQKKSDVMTYHCNTGYYKIFDSPDFLPQDTLQNQCFQLFFSFLSCLEPFAFFLLLSFF